MTIHAYNILALDLGTNTGWAVRSRDGVITHGTCRFLHAKLKHPGMRWSMFRGWLVMMVAHHHIHRIAYEEVRRHEGTTAAHVYGAFEALTQLTAAVQNIPLLPAGVGVIKKHWTGKGNANKDAMIAEAHRRGFTPDTDNAADALAILDWAATQE